METQLITLTAEELLALILEKSVQREGLCLTSAGSFLAILGLLEHEMTKSMPHVRSKPA